MELKELIAKDLLKINDDDVKKYLKAISSKSPKSVSHSLSALKSFYNYILIFLISLLYYHLIQLK